MQGWFYHAGLDRTFEVTLVGRGWRLHCPLCGKPSLLLPDLFSVRVAGDGAVSIRHTFPSAIAGMDHTITCPTCWQPFFVVNGTYGRRHSQFTRRRQSVAS